jgi:hypothetical protein
VEVSQSEFVAPAAMVFFPGRDLFLAVCNHTAYLWNTAGALVTVCVRVRQEISPWGLTSVDQVSRAAVLAG